MCKAVGAHVSNSEGLGKVVEWVQFYGMTAVQVFLGAPQRLMVPTVHKSVRDRWKEEKIRVGFKFYVHASYVINFAESGQVGSRFVWYATQLLELANDLDADGTIFHCGTWGKKIWEEGFENSYSNWMKVHQRVGGKILIENMASPKDPKGKLDKITLLVKALPANFGICLDTAHAYAAGYSFDDKAAIDCLQVDLDPYVRLIHLNDVAAKVKKGGGLDRHANFERNAESLLYLAKYWDCDMILERGEEFVTDLMVLKEMGLF